MEEEISALLSRANLARVRGNLEEAQAICHTALELSPMAADAHSLLGDLFLAQDKHDEALHCYSVASDLKPQSASFREKRDKELQVRHSRLLTQQQKAQKPTLPKPEAQATGSDAPQKTPTKPRPRWLTYTLIGVGGVVMILLGFLLGNWWEHRNDLKPTKVPLTIGR
jgi:tetratricopeptide (TPR) repeat protein